MDMCFSVHVLDEPNLSLEDSRTLEPDLHVKRDKDVNT